MFYFYLLLEGENIIKLTHEEFLCRLNEVNQNLEVLEEYKNSSTKILFKCKICGHEWMATPNKILLGRGCPYCAGNKRKTNEEFLLEMKKINPYIDFLTDYISTSHKIKCHCKICEHEWETNPGGLLRGQGCPECGNKTRSDKLRKSHKDFINEIKLINPNITIVSQYDGQRKKIKCQCNVCGYLWETYPSVLLQHHGCPACSRKRNTMTLDDFIFRYKDKLNPSIEIIGNYTSINNKVLVQCKKCGYKYYVEPNRLARGQGCHKCSNISRTIPKEEIIERIMLKNNTIEMIGKYTNVSTKTMFQCKICGHKWDIEPKNILYNNTGCPLCASSHGEIEIATVLSNNNIVFETQKQFNGLVGDTGKALSYDFYIPNFQFNQYMGMLIEYQGKQHYEEVAYFGGLSALLKRQRYDDIKREYAKMHNIYLLEINFDENIEDKLIKNLKL